jgi:hypothetical protein
MIPMKLIALALLLPIYWWSGLPFESTVELAEHYVTTPEGEHCNESCPHPVSLIDPPRKTSTLDISCDAPVFQECLIALLPPSHLARDHPPPLFYSLSHSLRAPPTLIPA